MTMVNVPLLVAASVAVACAGYACLGGLLWLGGRHFGRRGPRELARLLAVASAWTVAVSAGVTALWVVAYSTGFESLGTNVGAAVVSSLPVQFLAPPAYAFTKYGLLPGRDERSETDARGEPRR